MDKTPVQLITRIKQSELTQSKKREVIRKLRDMAETGKANFKDGGSLLTAFFWERTEEGPDYWNEVCQKIRKAEKEKDRQNS